MKNNKGGVLILIVLVLTVTSTFLLYSYSNFLINSQRDFLFSKYYERAALSALSCREVAAARVNVNFQYRILNTEISSFNCKYSIVTNPDFKSKDIYVDVFATGTVNVPVFIYFKPISISLKSTIRISHIGPTILKTTFQ